MVDLKERGWKYVGCMPLAQDRDQQRERVNTVINLRVPKRLGLLQLSDY